MFFRPFYIFKLTYHHEKGLVDDEQLPSHFNISSPVGLRDKNEPWVQSKQCLYVIYYLWGKCKARWTLTAEWYTSFRI